MNLYTVLCLQAAGKIQRQKFYESVHANEFVVSANLCIFIMLCKGLDIYYF